MFQSRLSEFVEPRGRANTNSRFIRQFKISCQNIEILARIVDLSLTAIASTLGGVVYQQFWFENPAMVDACLSIGIINGLLFVSLLSTRGLYRLPVLLAPLRYFGRLLAIFAATALLAAGSLLFLKGNVAFPAAPLVTALLPQMILLVIARWVFAKATRALLSAGRLDGRRGVTVGEPGGLQGIGAKF